MQYNLHMSSGGALHKLTKNLHSITQLWSGNGQINELANQTSILIWFRKTRSIRG